MKPNNIYLGDCLELMKKIPNNKIDLILCDLPYGTTRCTWDTVIPFEPLWEQYKRIIKANGAIVLFGSQPFTSNLVMSNQKDFRYEVVWEKTKGGGFLSANFAPLKRHENIMVFYRQQPTYNAQKWRVSEEDVDKRKTINNPINSKKDSTIQGSTLVRNRDDGTRFPTSVVKFSSVWQKGQHPTQKPVELFEYLIRTYTNENELVLDNCIGSGTTAIACIRTNRRFLGFEKDPEYYRIAVERVNKEYEIRSD